jgi:acetyl-CoA carboxylase biotin carboxyl carrier protein
VSAPDDQGPAPSLEAAERDLLLGRAHQIALEVLDRLPPASGQVRVAVADVIVEAEWTSAAPAVAPAAAVTPVGVPVGGGLPPADPPRGGHEVTAPSVGTFYRRPEPGAKPFVVEGDVVRVGQQVGIVEAMKLMIPVEADRAGRVEKILRQDGDAVEYGEPLFALALAGER